MTNEQYCYINSLCAKLKPVAPWSIWIDVVARRERVLNGQASVKKFADFLKRETRRLEAAV